MIELPMIIIKSRNIVNSFFPRHFTRFDSPNSNQTKLPELTSSQQIEHKIIFLCFFFQHSVTGNEVKSRKRFTSTISLRSVQSTVFGFKKDRGRLHRYCCNKSPQLYLSDLNQHRTLAISESPSSLTCQTICKSSGQSTTLQLLLKFVQGKKRSSFHPECEKFEG